MTRTKIDLANCLQDVALTAALPLVFHFPSFTFPFLVAVLASLLESSALVLLAFCHVLLLRALLKKRALFRARHMLFVDLHLLWSTRGRQIWRKICLLRTLREC